MTQTGRSGPFRGKPGLQGANGETGNARLLVSSFNISNFLVCHQGARLHYYHFFQGGDDLRTEIWSLLSTPVENSLQGASSETGRSSAFHLVSGEEPGIGPVQGGKVL